MFSPWQLAAIDEAGYNGISQEHLEKVARSMKRFGVKSVDLYTLKDHCRRCGIDYNNFNDDDIEALEEMLEED